MSFDSQDSSESVPWDELVTSSEIQQLSDNLQSSHSSRSPDGRRSSFSFGSLPGDILYRIYKRATSNLMLVLQSHSTEVYERSLNSASSKRVMFSCSPLQSLDLGVHDEDDVDSDMKEHTISGDFGPPKLVGTSHGLLCLIDDTGRFMLWNPSTGSCQILKRPPIRKISIYAFWEESSDFQVFAGGRRSKGGPWEIALFSVTKKQWKEVGDRLIDDQACLDGPGHVANSTVHWLDTRKQNVVTFDILFPTVGSISLPPGNIRIKRIGVAWTTESFFELVAYGSTANTPIIIWQRQQAIWVEKLRLTSQFFPFQSTVRPVCFLYENELLLKTWQPEQGHFLSIFDPRNMSIRNLAATQSMPANFTPMIFKETPISATNPTIENTQWADEMCHHFLSETVEHLLFANLECSLVEVGHWDPLLHMHCAVLFRLMEERFEYCKSITVNRILFDVFKVFFRVVKEYAKILSAKLPKGFTDKDQRRIFVIVRAAIDCQERFGTLAESVKCVIHADYKDSVDIYKKKDVFSPLISEALETLVLSLQEKFSIEMATMRLGPWNLIRPACNKSKYVSDIEKTLTSNMPLIRTHLSSTHFQLFLGKLGPALCRQFYKNIFNCQLISEAGAQQILLDARAVGNILLEIQSPESQIANSYSDLVNLEISKAAALLEVIKSSNHSIVRTYCIMLPKGTIQEFWQIVKLKGFEIIWQLAVSPALPPEPNLIADFSLSDALAGMCESDEWQTLVHNLQTDLDNAMASMIQVSWATIDYTHDRSGYVDDIENTLASNIPLIGSLFSTMEFQLFLVKLGPALCQMLFMNIFKCNQISKIGAQLMLRDFHKIKNILIRITCPGHQISKSYRDIVRFEMRKSKALLQVVESSNDSLPQTYDRFVPNGTLREFLDILKLKGLEITVQYSNCIPQSHHRQSAYDRRMATLTSHLSNKRHEQPLYWRFGMRKSYC